MANRHVEHQRGEDFAGKHFTGLEPLKIIYKYLAVWS